MALNTVQLKKDIYNILSEMEKKETDAKDEYADKLSQAIAKFVKSGEVAPGITVSTTGTAAAQTGTTTGKGTII